MLFNHTSSTYDRHQNLPWHILPWRRSDTCDMIRNRLTHLYHLSSDWSARKWSALTAYIWFSNRSRNFDMIVMGSSGHLWNTPMYLVYATGCKWNHWISSEPNKSWSSNTCMFSSGWNGNHRKMSLSISKSVLHGTTIISQYIHWTCCLILHTSSSTTSNLILIGLCSKSKISVCFTWLSHVFFSIDGRINRPTVELPNSGTGHMGNHSKWKRELIDYVY